MRYLALVLLAPWLAILGWAYWAYPKRLPRHARRRGFDVLALLLAIGLAVQAALLGFDGVETPTADRFGPASGAIWQQVAPPPLHFRGLPRWRVRVEPPVRPTR